MRKIKLYGDGSPQSQSSTGDLGEFTGIEGQSGKSMCQGGKPDTGKFHSSYNILVWLHLWEWARGRWHVCGLSITLGAARVRVCLSVTLHLISRMSVRLKKDTIYIPNGQRRSEIISGFL